MHLWSMNIWGKLFILWCTYPTHCHLTLAIVLFLVIARVNPILVSIFGRQLCCTMQCFNYFSFVIFFIIRFSASFFFHGGVFIHHKPPAITFIYFPLFFQFIDSFGCCNSNGWVAIFCQSLQLKPKGRKWSHIGCENYLLQ